MIAEIKCIPYVQTKKQKHMKKIFISIPALLVMIGCDYDPVLTSTERTKQTHGSLELLIIVCSLAIIMMIWTWPKKKNFKN